MIKGRLYYKQKSKVYKILTEEIFFESITEAQLKEVANRLVSRVEGLNECTRFEKRFKKPLIDWYERNWGLIEKHVRSIVPVDDDDKILPKFDKKGKFLWKFRDEIPEIDFLQIFFDSGINDDSDDADFYNDQDCYDDWSSFSL